VEAQDTLNTIASEVRICKNCTLHHSRKNSVPGEGPADAKIMFIGEGPGVNENEQGRPLLGLPENCLKTCLPRQG
jgi:uracil-DNA glycosylase family 4